MLCRCFFFNDTATTEIYTLSLHDALPIFPERRLRAAGTVPPIRFPAAASLSTIPAARFGSARVPVAVVPRKQPLIVRSEEHTSELQSRQYLVCRLLLEKKKKTERCVVLPW